MRRSFDIIGLFPSQGRQWQNVHYADTVRFLFACAIAIQGLLNELIALLPMRPRLLILLTRLLDHIAPFMPVIWSGTISSIDDNMALFLGFLLLLIAYGLARGKKQAWYLAATLLPLSIALHLARGTGLLSALPTGFLLLALLASNVFFQVKSDPWRCHQGFILLGIGWLLFLVYSVGGLYLLRQQFLFKDNLEDLISGLLLRVLHLHSPAIIPLTRHADWFLQSLSYLSVLIVITGLFFMLRPISLRWWESCHQERLEALRVKGREMVRLYGEQTLSFFALAPENLMYIAPQAEGLIHYRLIGNVATVPGDPICAPEHFKRVTQAFLALCRSNDWQISFYQAHPKHLATYEQLGLLAYKIGEEAIIDLRTFTLSGSAMSNVRCTCRRAERENIHIEWYEGTLSEAVRIQLSLISRAWLAEKAGKHATEMGFSMGRFSDLFESVQRADLIADQQIKQDHCERAEPPRMVTGVAFSSAGRPCAFVTFTPLYGPIHAWGWALDLIRRIPDAPPGTIDLLLVKAIERFRERQATIMSLGMIAMADANQEMTPTHRQIASFATQRLHLLEKYRSLYQFKKKFQPRWESRYMVVGGTLALPKAALAILRAHQA